MDYTDPTRSSQRLSNAEREDAVAALSEFQVQGRLSADEFAQRAEAARRAVTWGDLSPFFVDLPSGATTGAKPSATFPVSSPPSGYDTGGTRDAGPSWSGRRRPLGGALGATVMALMPFIALGLFFLSLGIWDWDLAWLWFLLIPVAGIVIWGPYGHDRQRR